MQADKTPWWLLLLRALAVAAAIIGFAGSGAEPRKPRVGHGPAVDRGRWWLGRCARLAAPPGKGADPFGRGRPRGPCRRRHPTDRSAAADRLSTRRKLGRSPCRDDPHAFAPSQFADWATRLPSGDFDSYWLSDGLDHPDRAALQTALAAKGRLTVFQSPRPIFALRPAGFDSGKILLTAARAPATETTELEVIARGPDPSGIDRELARSKIAFDAGAAEAKTSLDLPPELRNRITRFELLGQRSVGAVSLTDDSLKRRKIALISSASRSRGAATVVNRPIYLRQALAPVADLIEGGLSRRDPRQSRCDHPCRCRANL